MISSPRPPPPSLHAGMQPGCLDITSASYRLLFNEAAPLLTNRGTTHQSLERPGEILPPECLALNSRGDIAQYSKPKRRQVSPSAGVRALGAAVGVTMSQTRSPSIPAQTRPSLRHSGRTWKRPRKKPCRPSSARRRC
jgi:hypothetical protein